MDILKSAVGYCRYSSDHQKELSIEAQQRAIETYADKNGYSIKEWYIDRAFSGQTDNRPDFQRLIKDIEEGNGDFKAVIVHKLDRFSRSVVDSFLYKQFFCDRGIELISTEENISGDEFIFGINALLNQRYVKNLSKEVMKGLKERAYKGLFNGGKPPLGYDVKEQRLAINEAEAVIVREIFEMAASGMGYSSITKALNAKGYKTKRGQPFGKSSLYDLLRNEKYKGTYVYNRSSGKKSNGKRNNHKNKDESEIIRIEDGCPAIVSKDLWNRANYSRKITAITSTNSKHTYLLTGLVTCGICGSKMHGNYHNNGNKKAYSTYRCNKKSNQSICDQNAIRADILEDFVIKSLIEHFFNDSVTNTIINQVNAKIADFLKNDSESLKQAKASLAGLRMARANLTDTVAEIGYNKTLTDKLNSLEMQISEYERIIATEQEQKSSIIVTKDDVKNKISELKEIMCNPKNAEQTKMILREYIERVCVTNQSVEVTFKVAFTFLIDDNKYIISYNHSKKESRYSIMQNVNECLTTPKKHWNIENLTPFGSIGDESVTKRTPNPYRIESSVVEARRVELLSKNQSIPASPSADISLNSLTQALNVKLVCSVAPKQ